MILNIETFNYLNDLELFIIEEKILKKNVQQIVYDSKGDRLILFYWVLNKESSHKNKEVKR